MRNPRTAVITVVHGRHDHLRRQHAALARSTMLPTEYIIVGMNDPAIEPIVTDGPLSPQVVTCDALGDRLPLAAARNRGAALALAGGAEVLVFLDVDCLPDASLVSAYAAAALDRQTRDRLLCGPVAYLPEVAGGDYDLDTLDELARPHPARPAPNRGEVQLGGDHSLFWSLSFAVTADTWHRIGGFCDRYEGYGAEDTDFAWTARRREVGLAWIGSARAYHQFHQVSDPPVEHVHDIVRNATLFHERWGVWPMSGWLDEFERLGLVERDGMGGYHACLSDRAQTNRAQTNRAQTK